MMPIFRVHAFKFGLDYYESARELGFVEADNKADALELARAIDRFAGERYDGGYAEGSVTEIEVFRSREEILTRIGPNDAQAKLRSCRECSREAKRFFAQNKLEHGVTPYHEPSDYCVICDHLRSGRHVA